MGLAVLYTQPKGIYQKLELPRGPCHMPPPSRTEELSGLTPWQEEKGYTGLMAEAVLW